MEMNLVKLVDDFGCDEKCRSYMEALRWPKGIRCTRCGSDKVARIEKRDQLHCNSCQYHFSVTSGTVFHDTHLPLWKWFLATYLMCESKKGMSANQMKRTIKVAYKTAWYLCHRIRAAMKEVQPDKLSGVVEVDETLIGGKRKRVGKGYRGNKTMVVGVVQRGGKIRLQVIPGADRKTLHGFITANTKPETKAIFTDDWPAYDGCGDADTSHETVNHSIEEWVRGDVHTNTVEGVWSLVKRAIVGSYHKVSVKHLNAYLDEVEFRQNNRRNQHLFRDTLARLLETDAVPYESLTQS